MEAADHDLQPAAPGTPVGIWLPTSHAWFVDGSPATVPREGLEERLVQWWASVRARFAHLTTLVLHWDNGPEHQSRRTQVMQRLGAFGPRYPLRVRLADSPPSPRKDNPIERGWGSLEHPWNGALLASMEAVLAFTRTMTWHGVHPVVALVTTP